MFVNRFDPAERGPISRALEANADRIAAEVGV
jgi:hypothetical protein